MIHCICIHCDMTQEERNKVMQDFHASTRILVSTDILSRGIDVQQVLVLNYNKERYIHVLVMEF